MKRFVLSLAAVAALFFAVDTARADWNYVISPAGWYGWEWDPTNDDGTFNDPPTNYMFKLKVFGVWYAVVGLL